MAPTKSSRNHDDKADAPTGKDKHAGHTSTKMRRGASQTSASHHREPAAAPTSAPIPPVPEQAPPTLPWPSFEREALHTYRREHQLSAPSSYASSYHHAVLTRPGGIGLYSPTLVRKNKTRRQGKEQLALAVRKHFNGLGIQENDVIVDFIYKIRNEKSFQSDGPNNQPVIVTEQ